MPGRARRRGRQGSTGAVTVRRDRGVTWDCTNTPEQQFVKVRLTGGDNDFLLLNQRSGMCLRPSGSSTDNGALIEQALCNTGDLAQHWTSYDPNPPYGDGFKWLKNVSSGRCLEDTAWSGSNGTLLTRDDCVVAWKQYWWGV